MRIKGKIAVWFWGLAVGANLLIIYCLGTDENKIAGLIGWVLLDLLFLPILFRNYVEIKEGYVTVVFGIFKDSMEIDEIKEIYKTHDPLSTTAASLDRTVIKGRRQELRCAVKDREELYQELKKYNSEIVKRF